MKEKLICLNIKIFDNFKKRDNMDCIYVTMFGTPEVYKNKDRISFPFKKAEGLFYYLIVNKGATRDELVNLLWADIDEETAKKNLRNALYRIKKTFNMDIFISPKKSNVMLNEDIVIDSDILKIQKCTNDYVNLYRGEFLHGFYVKDAEEFDKWLKEKREQYKNIYILKLYDQIDSFIKENDTQKLEEYTKLIINIDTFDEKAYRILMEYYLRMGSFNKAIDTYKKLYKLLDEELGITPDNETTDVYNKIQSMKSLRDVSIKGISKEFFYGRENELNSISTQYYNFLNGVDAKSIIIIGEAGIGKTRLKEKFLNKVNKDNIYLIEANCYQVEEEYFLKPWNMLFSNISDIVKRDNISISESLKSIVGYLFPSFAIRNNINSLNIMDKIDNYKYQMAEEAVLGILEKVSNSKRLLIVLEDIQWMDTTSVLLLESIILHNKGNISFICTCRNGYDKKMDRFINPLMKYNKLQKIEIKRFTRDETVDFINMTLPKKYITNELNEKIYEETEGNTFFLVEFLNSIKEKRDINIMSSKIHDILKSRFIDMSADGLKILNIAAMFFDEIPIEILMELSAKDDFEIIDIMEELEERYIIKEINIRDKISFGFTHQKLREYIYMNQSLGKRKILHSKIAGIIEGNLKNDKSDEMVYSKLIYHFLNGGNRFKALYYSIKNASIYLDFTHELFPIIRDSNAQDGSHMYISTEQSKKYIYSIEELLKGIKKEGKIDDSLRKLEMSYLHMKGRYLIREGDYESGVAIIHDMIQSAMEMKNTDYALKGYRQMINYGIQVHNVALMKEYIEIALKLAIDKNLMEDIGILLRLKGLSDIMAGSYGDGEEYLKKSINTFNIINKEDKYSLNIAAAYNYIGEIRRHTMQFKGALKYYDKAIDICERNNLITGLTVFTTNAGQAAFEMGDYIMAKAYFKKSLDIYEKLDFTWGRSTAESFMSLLHVKQGNYREALISIKNADKFASKLKSPYEIGLVYRIKAEIKANMINNSNLKKEFKGYLSLDLDEYCNSGIEYLNKVKDSYEIDILKVLKNSSDI